jgi:hypothetical protein
LAGYAPDATLRSVRSATLVATIALGLVACTGTGVH